MTSNKILLIPFMLTTLTAVSCTEMSAPGTGAAAQPASGASPCSDPEAAAFAQLKTIAAARRASIPDGVSTYTHFGTTVLAHAPLAGIEKLSASDLAAGAPIMAIFVQGDGSGRIPNGAYIVRIQFQPGAVDGSATYLDAAGNEVVRVDAVMRDRAEINSLFPGAYGDPPPSNIPVITSTHVWHGNSWAVDCTGAGWNWKVFYY